MEMKNITNQLIDSYEIRVTMVNLLIDQTRSLLMAFQTEIQEMLDALRQNLARTESLRKADFDRMMHAVLSQHQQTRDALEASLATFHQEEAQMIGVLRNLVNQPVDAADLDGWHRVHDDIVSRQMRREQRMIHLIKRFQIEQEDLKAGLKHLIARGDAIRIRDLRGMLKTLHVQRSDYDGLILQLMGHFQDIRARLCAQWQGV